jgi:hypothetical protein
MLATGTSMPRSAKDLYLVNKIVLLHENLLAAKVS